MGYAWSLFGKKQQEIRQNCESFVPLESRVFSEDSVIFMLIRFRIVCLHQNLDISFHPNNDIRIRILQGLFSFPSVSCSMFADSTVSVRTVFPFFPGKARPVDEKRYCLALKFSWTVRLSFSGFASITRKCRWQQITDINLETIANLSALLAAIKTLKNSFLYVCQYARRNFVSTGIASVSQHGLRQATLSCWGKDTKNSIQIDLMYEYLN